MRSLYITASICALLCTGCIGTPGYEMPVFKGAVLDGMTNAPIPNAQVRVTPFGGSGLTWAAVSNAAGRFEVERSRRSSFMPIPFKEGWVDAWVDVSAEGYEPQRVVMLDLTKRILPDIMVALTRRQGPAPAPSPA
jgi:hypothetical protein